MTIHWLSKDDDKSLVIVSTVTAAAIASAGFQLGGVAAVAVVAGPGIVAVALLTAAAVSNVFVIRRKTAEAIGTAVVLLLAVPGLALGSFFRALTVHVLSSVVWARSGFYDLPRNWSRILFATDTWVSPELLITPSDREPEYSLRRLYDDFLKDFKGAPSSDKVIKLIVFPLFALICLPSFFYRLSIKSTFWLYGPLLYLAYQPAFSKEAALRKAWLKATPAKVLEWVWLCLSIITVVLTAYTTADPGRVWALAQAGEMGETPFTLLSGIFVLDVAKLQPWHLCTVPSAILTVGLFFYLDNLRKDVEAETPVDMNGTKVSVGIWLYRLRGALGMVWIAMMLWYAGGHLYDTCRFEDLPYFDRLIYPDGCVSR